MMNKQGAHILLLSLAIFMLFSQSTSARLLLETSQGSASSITITDEEEDMATLMGLEKCNENDDECINRRMVADIHLDYIYTHQNPKPKMRDSP